MRDVMKNKQTPTGKVGFGHKCFPLLSLFGYGFFCHLVHIVLSAAWIADDITPTRDQYYDELRRFCHKLAESSYVDEALEFIRFSRFAPPYDVVADDIP